ncbi:hypothetical protein MKEN_01242100 [Mycena kentingensis (nom. inval.)]|nr:hypothetical protein MKEN_01242100 [Mycena kentingensis (nom. inval.)]
MIFGSFNTSWAVPAPPAANDGQTIFLHQSFEPGSFLFTLEATLQWGPSAAGGGAFWAVASWYIHSIHDGPTFFTPAFQVNQGQRLDASISLFNSVPSSPFNYICQFKNLPGTMFQLVNTEEFRWAEVGLEWANVIVTHPTDPFNGVTKREDYPTGSTVFTPTTIQFTNGEFPAQFWGSSGNEGDRKKIAVENDIQGNVNTVTINYGP